MRKLLLRTLKAIRKAFWGNKKGFTSESNVNRWQKQEIETARIINLFRANNGLDMLRLDKKCWIESLKRVYFQLTQPKITHKEFSKSSKTLRKEGLRVVGEVLAAGDLNPQQALEAWASTDSNRSILLSTSYKYIGVCVRERDNVNFYGVIVAG